MTRKEAKESFLMEVQCALSQPGSKKIVSFEVIDQIYNDHEAQIKAKDEKLQQLDDAYASVVSDFESAVMEIESLKKIINTSIEEIEYAIIKPQYADVYLNNAIRFLKETK